MTVGIRDRGVMDAKILAMGVLGPSVPLPRGPFGVRLPPTSPLSRVCALPFLILAVAIFPIFGGRLLDGLLFLAAAIGVRLRFMPGDDIRLSAHGRSIGRQGIRDLRDRRR